MYTQLFTFIQQKKLNRKQKINKVQQMMAPRKTQTNVMFTNRINSKKKTIDTKRNNNIDYRYLSWL